MMHAYKSADFVYIPTQVVPPFRAISRARNVKKHSFGYNAPPVGQFIYLTKLLFLLSIDLDEDEECVHFVIRLDIKPLSQECDEEEKDVKYKVKNTLLISKKKNKNI